MNRLLKEYGITKTKRGYSLRDIAKNIIRSKNVKDYMRKTKKRYGLNGDYVDDETFYALVCRSIGTGINDFKKKFKILHKAKMTQHKGIIRKTKKLKGDTCISNGDKCMFVFRGKIITVIFDVNKSPWFVATEVIEIMGYVNIDNAMNKIDKSNKIAKKDFNELKNDKINEVSFKVIRSAANLINEEAVFNLVYRSRKHISKEFGSWIFNDLFPELRRLGYHVDDSDRRYVNFVNVDDYKDDSVVYLLKVGDAMYKFGDTYDVYRRLGEHKCSFNSYECIRLYGFIRHKNMKGMANEIKSYVKSIGINHKDSGSNMEELFVTTKQYPINKIIIEFDNIYNKYSDSIKEVTMDNNINKTDTLNISNEDRTLNKIIEFGDKELVREYIEMMKMRMQVLLSGKKLDSCYDNINVCTKDVQCSPCLSDLDKVDKSMSSNNEKPKKKLATKKKKKVKVKVEPEEEPSDEEEDVYGEISDEDDAVSDVEITSDDIQEESDSVSDEPPEPEPVKVKAKPKSKKRAGRPKTASADSTNTECKTCGKKVSRGARNCVKCMGMKSRKVKDRPSIKQLKEDLETSNYVQVGKKYGVSDNCIRKWMRNG